MAFTTNMRPETLKLLEEYKVARGSSRRKIKRSIYALEIPYIRARLANIEDIDEKILETEYHRVAANTLEYLLSSEDFDSEEFDNTLDPSSNKNIKSRSNMKHLYELFNTEGTSYKKIERQLKKMSNEEKAAFEQISGISLEIFDSMIH